MVPPWSLEAHASAEPRIAECTGAKMSHRHKKTNVETVPQATEWKVHSRQKVVCNECCISMSVHELENI